MAQKKPKKKSLSTFLKAPLDSIMAHLGRIWDNMGPRDLVYFIAYMAAVYLVYKTMAAVKAVFTPKSMWDFIWLAVSPVTYAVKGTVEYVLAPPAETLDPEILATALVGGYMLLKIDVADVTSAIGKLSSVAIQSMVVVP